MSLTYHPMTGDGADFDNVIPYGALTPIGNQDFEWARQAIAIAMYGGYIFPLGGAETPKNANATWLPVLGRQRHTLRGDYFGNLTTELVVSYCTADAGTAVQVRLWDLTNSDDLGTTTTASVSLTIVTETITVAMPDAATEYELQLNGSNDAAGVMAWGFLRARYVP